MNKTPTAVRRVQFCAGHRVMNHESKCRNLHGHNYVVFFHARAKELDNLGRVIDFSVLKEKLGGWVDECWDHGFIYFEQDMILEKMLTKMFHEDKIKLYSLPTNPTAENMASYLLHDVGPRVLNNTDVELFKVVLWETENCYVEAEL